MQRENGKPETTDERPDDIVGHKTFRDGTTQFRHEPLTRAEADAFLTAADEAKSKREKLMPTEQTAIDMMFEAWLRLKELGWREAVYCPKDGSCFDAIEPGSTGIFRTHYTGDWPTGSWWAEDGGDLWPAHPILHRLDPEAEAARRAKMAEAARCYREEIANGR